MLHYSGIFYKNVKTVMSYFLHRSMLCSQLVFLNTVPLIQIFSIKFLLLDTVLSMESILNYVSLVLFKFSPIIPLIPWPSHAKTSGLFVHLIIC
jgi:hypothetical protein